MERVKGIEPSSSAWKADIMSHYTTPAIEMTQNERSAWSSVGNRLNVGVPTFHRLSSLQTGAAHLILSHFVI